MICGIILAGGESSRMKSPKALLKFGAETFVKTVISKLESCGVSRIILVTGAHQEVEHSVRGLEKINVIQNENYKRGQFSSLRKAVASIPEDADGVIVWPVDLPLVKLETARRLIEEFQSQSNPVTIPVFQGRRGHPVIYNNEAMQKILSLNDDHTGKELQSWFDGRISYVETDDGGILIDIDTPEDYEKHISGRN